MDVPRALTGFNSITYYCFMYAKVAHWEKLIHPIESKKCFCGNYHPISYFLHCYEFYPEKNCLFFWLTVVAELWLTHCASGPQCAIAFKSVIWVGD